MVSLMLRCAKDVENKIHLLGRMCSFRKHDNFRLHKGFDNQTYEMSDYSRGFYHTPLITTSQFWQQNEIRSPNLLINSYHQGCVCVYVFMSIHGVCVSIPRGRNCSNDLLNVKWTVVGRKHHADMLAASSLAFHALIVSWLLWFAHSTEVTTWSLNKTEKMTCTHFWSLKATTTTKITRIE